jgi:hypothetical protein
MDPDEIARSTIALDRQERAVRVDVHGRPIVPSRVPETRPTPLQDWFIELSIIVLVCGVVAIGALELGASLGTPLVKAAVVVGGLVLLAVTLDAIVRIWRSAWVWLPVNRGRGLFRFVWAGVLALSLVLVAGAMLIVLRA